MDASSKLWRKYSQATKQSSQDISQILSVLGNGFGFYIRGCYAFVKWIYDVQNLHDEITSLQRRGSVHHQFAIKLSQFR